METKKKGRGNGTAKSENGIKVTPRGRWKLGMEEEEIGRGIEREEK